MIPFLLGASLLFDKPIVTFLNKVCKLNRLLGILITLCTLVWGMVIGVALSLTYFD